MAVRTQIYLGQGTYASAARTLTIRELEVLDGIQRGLTNRQIAGQLFVSTNTINKHVQSVLRKLDVRNRVQAAVYRRGIAL